MNTCYASFLTCALIAISPAAAWAESEEQERGPYLRLGSRDGWHSDGSSISSRSGEFASAFLVA